MAPLPDQEMLERLGAAEEKIRYQALLELRDGTAAPSPAVLTRLEALDLDASREVRQLAREVRTRFGARPQIEAREMAEVTTPPESPGNTLLALISWGSAVSGLLGTGMSFINYYFVGRFPFPNALDVLVVVNLFLVVPFLILGALLLFPGRAQKRAAWIYAWVSLVVCALLIFGLQPVFERYWAFQFTQTDADLFRRFLSPVQLLTALLPVLAGQSLQLYFLSQYLVPAPPAGAGNDVDSPSQGD